MTTYDDCIYLRGKTKVCDIADCIAKTFSGFGINFPVFQADTLKYCFKFELECGSVYLQRENKSFYFTFKGLLNESEECISIKYNEADNRLEYSETFSVLRFLTAFFNNCRAYLGKRLFPDVVQVNREILQDFCVEINDVDIKADELRITFYADEDGKLLFPQEWMEKLANDLYFMDINHRYDKGLSVLNIDFDDEQRIKHLCEHFKQMIMEKHIGKLKGNMWDCLSTEDDKERFKSFLKALFESQKRRLKETFILSPDAKITIETQKNKTEITKKIFECTSYEEFCAFILNEALKLREPKFISSDSENNTLISCESDGKYKFENKKLEMELQKTKTELKKLRNQNKELLDELKELKCRIPADNKVCKTDITETSGIIDELKAKNHELKEKNKQLEQGLNGINAKSEYDSDGFITLSIPCTEANLFKNEIEDYCYGVLYSALEYEKQNLPQNKEDENSRKADVIADILANREFKWENTETFSRINGIENILKSSRKPCVQELEKCGFVPKSSYRKHQKCYYHKKRYQVFFSLTPSDANAPNLKMKEIRARFFLLPVKYGYDSTEKNREIC